MAGGTFSKTSRPKLPGSYTNFIAQAQTVVPPSIGSVVAIPFTHDWGPLNTAVHVSSLGEFKAIFGSSEDTPGFIAVMQAFKGEGLPGSGGAGEVVCYRAGAASAAKATRNFNNTGATPALTIDALYEGTRGNDFSVTVQDYAADSTQTELIVYDAGGVELERFRFADTDIAGLVAQINTASEWIHGTVLLDGTALAPVASVALTGGDDGSALLAADWTDAMSTLEVERFSIFAPYDLTDAPTVVSLKTWAQGLNASGKRFMTILGGALDEDLTAAITRAESLADENFLTIGVGSVSDAVLGTLSTSQLAPRIAGILAARGEAMSLTYARLADVSILTGVTTAQAATAYDNGILVLGRDSNVDAPVRIEVAVTTYIADTTTKPRAVYGDPKFMRTMQTFEMEIAEYAEANIIGKLQVNQKTREAVLGEMQSRLRRRADAGVIQDGWTVGIDQDPAPSDDDKFVALVYSIKFGRSVEQVFSTIRVG